VATPVRRCAGSPAASPAPACLDRTVRASSPPDADNPSPADHRGSDRLYGIVGRSPVAVAPPDAPTARCIGGSSWCRPVTANVHKWQWMNSKQAPKSLLPPHRGCACWLPHPARRDEDPDPEGGPNPTGQRGPATGPFAKSVHVAATRRATYFGANRIINGSKPTFPGSISSWP
jgi:hypothetical protein